MSATTEQVLAAQRDPQALAGFCEDNAGLVHECVWRLLRRVGNADRTPGGLEREDLAQVAWIGFLKAVRGFDPARGTTFGAYATPTIEGLLLLANRLTSPGGVHITRKEFYAGLRAEAVSTDAALPGDDEDVMFGALLTAADDPAADATEDASLGELLHGLTDIQRAVVDLLVFCEKTQTEAGAALGLDKSRVGRAFRAAVVHIAHRTGREAPPASRRLWQGEHMGPRARRVAS